VSEPEGRLHVGIVGLRFGAEFVPIYQRHPAVGEISIADTDPARLARVGDAFGVTRRHPSLDSLLADPGIDAVHLLTPVAFHADQAVATLRAGKHCACAVPMGTTLDALRAVIAAQEASQRQYMMMETSVFGREYFYVRGLQEEGELGELTFYRGFHLQDLDGFPPYWQAYPPMHYVTHALSPALALTGSTVSTVRCLGSGRLTSERRGGHDNPFPLEAGLFQIRGRDIVADITMSFFQNARAYTEGFSIYGSRAGVEWPDAEGGPLRVHELGEVPPGGRGRPVRVREVVPPDRADLLPAEIAGFTRPLSVTPGPGLAAVHVDPAHSGSHPHLVHEFVSGILSDRRPVVDAKTAAAWTAPGICAHQSALNGGQPVDVPDFTK
jgi:predicted dehydrogenase